MTQTPTKNSTVIIGAGFSGLFTALHLTNQGYPHPIVLIDRNERFCFKPLLYDYMSGELKSYQTNPIYVELLQDRPISLIRGTVELVDLEARQVCLTDGRTEAYDNLVIAPGSVPSFFAKGAADHAFTFHSKADADTLKEHLMARCQEALQQSSGEPRSLMTVAVVGSGPVGVELALTLGDLLPQWYRNIADAAVGETSNSLEDIRIVLLNRSDILKGDVNSLLRDTAMSAMEDRVVQPEVLLGASVTAVHSNSIEFTRNDQPECLSAGTIIWTAGTKVHPLIEALPIPKNHRTKRGQLLVKPTLQLLAYPEVFAAGDCAVIGSEEGYAKPLPATAQVAYQQGGAIAAALLAKAKQKNSLPSANISLRGTVMKLGIGKAVANIFDRYEISGTVGQTIRRMMYLSLTPTPGYNVGTTLSWIKDDVFNAHAGEFYDIDYTAGYEVEELLALSAAVTLSATAVSRAEIGFISDQLESVALRQALAGAMSKYPDNSVIHALFGHPAKRRLALNDDSNSYNTLDQLLTKAITEIEQAVSVLSAKATPKELREYKKLVYYCSDCVARTSVPAILDNRLISSREEAVLERIKTALKI
ncbi:MAG: FAD-dependent oxidoreductase [Cyanobacteria bacterium J06581_3]